MPLRLLLPAIICFAASSAAADDPFTPPGIRPPDYAVAMATGGSFYRPGSKIVLHHGDWTRVAATRDTPNATYYLADESATISVNERTFWLVRGPDHSSIDGYAPRNTGERQTHLGERCTVWEVSRSKSVIQGGSGITHLSCVTDDGIEIWQKSLSSREVISSAEATQIERRPVSAEEVRPPRSRLALDWPDRDLLPPAPPEKPDHEVVLESRYSTGGTAIRTMRRHGPWQFTRETAGKLRTIEIVHAFQQIWLRYSTDESGTPKSLTIQRPTVPPVEQTTILAAPPQPANPGRTEVVLGETCSWFDMMPGAADGGINACLTEDGIELKETSWSGASHLREWTAIRLARRPIAIDEIKPPAELLAPQKWGIE
jgi:hypothetical protein